MGWLAALGLALALPAGADVLPVELELSILEGIAPGAGVTTATGLATVNGSGGGGHVASLALPGGLLATQTTETDPGGGLAFSTLVASLSNAAGSFAGGAGAAGPGLGGPMGVPGNVRLCVITGCGFFIDVPFTQNGTRGIGLPGPPVTVAVFGTTLSLEGGLWTTGTASVVTSNGTPTRQGFAHGPLSGTSSTALPGGALQLVTPIALRVGSPPTTLPLFGALTVRFAPEPAAGLAGLAGALALALAARRRRPR